MSVTDNNRTRAAASSIASGTPLEARANLAYRRGIVVADRETWPSMTGPIDEQLNGFIGQQQ